MLVIALALVVTLGPIGALPLAQAQNATHPASAPPPGDVWTVETHVDATVVDNYAKVNVTAIIANEGPDPEFPFEVQVPDDAYITGLTIERDDQVHHAEIEERGVARQTYEEAKDSKQTAGLVEKHRTSSVYSYLINVEAFETVTATLTYERYLSADKGVHTLPLGAPVSGFGRDMGAAFDVTVDHSHGVTSAWGEPSAQVSTAEGGGYHLTHEVGPRQTDASTPLDVHYTVAPTDDDGSLVSTIHNGRGYFAHAFRAPSDAADLPIDLTLVLDTSGSMNGMKIAQLQDAARQVVDSLDEGDRFNLVSFASSVHQPWGGLQPADADRRTEAVDAIDQLTAAGSTNIEAGIEQGMATYQGSGTSDEEDRLPVLVFLTDGQPTMGLQQPDQLRELAREANQADAHVFALAFGSDADWQLVHGLAEDGNGTAIHVPEGQGAEVDLRRFMAQLTAPVLKEVQMTYAPGIQAMNATAPLLFAGSELLVVGTFDPNLTRLDARVNATSPDGAATYEISEPIGEEQASFLPRLVAYHKVRQLQDRLDAQGADPQLTEEITTLALEHGFVTDQTSLVLTLPRHPDEPDTNQTVATDHAESGTGEAHETTADRSTGGISAPASDPVDAYADGTSRDAGSPAGAADGDDDMDSQATPADGEEPQDGTPGLPLLVVLAGLAVVATMAGRQGSRR